MKKNKIFLIEIYGGAVSELTKDCEWSVVMLVILGCKFMEVLVWGK